MNCPVQSTLRASLESQREPIAILGGGVSAQGAVQLLKKIGLPYVIYDQNPGRGSMFDLAATKCHRWVICSPSFTLEHPWTSLALAQGATCLSELDFASLYTTAPVIAITGTNGKTTVTTFLADFFKNLGHRAWSAGNIGRSLSEVIVCEQPGPKDFIFCEVSSFQAETSRWITLEHIIWTNFAPNHLNVHATLENYFKAKYRLVGPLLCPGGAVFCGVSVKQAAEQMGYVCPNNTHVVQPSPSAPGAFAVAPQRENFALIEAFCQYLHVPQERLNAFAQQFTRPKYRLEDLGIVAGNHYWNDAKSTNFAALESALQNFLNESVIWIGGGRSKGENLTDIVPVLKNRIELALLIGETGQELEPILQSVQIPAVEVKNIESALKYIKNACIQGKTIVFSPAFSSFDQFENYMARGKSFEEHVFGLR
ncbi:MAG: hypothetical protein K2L24_02100 [Opitutales bacterium]|nr:hypothetical protein [Opitutales bacterium]